MAQAAASDELALPLPAAVAAAPAVLDGDEIVELSIRPSPWLIMMGSARLLTAAGVLAAATLLAAQGTWTNAAILTITAATVLAAARLAWAALQWAGTVYLLTNRRVLRLRGVLTVDVAEAYLRHVRDVKLTATAPQRALRIGTVSLRCGEKAAPIEWEHLGRPAEVYQRVVRAVKRAQGGG